MTLVLSVGICMSPLVLFSIGLAIYGRRERKLKKLRDMYYNQHEGGMLSTLGTSFTIFSEAEIQQATNKYDSTKIIGQGGQGIVYIGTLDARQVAIKKCKTLGENQKKEFGKEMLILSRINHQNIVNLLGCCLEVEVPMLVYELISNGTLSQNLHAKNHGLILSWDDRLRIAQESADALSYLHSPISTPIHHGDVKSANILLDENYTAKVSDFGASKMVPTDESQFATLVQGTLGYLDPEYLVTSQLTDKSDAYSFGVVILELLTRMLPISFDKPKDQQSLSSCFLIAMKENKLLDLLDDQIKREEKLDLVMQVAELAKECLNMKGENRPSMKEVADRLQKIRMLGQKNWGQDHSEVESLLGEPSYYVDTGTKRASYLNVEKKVADNV